MPLKSHIVVQSLTTIHDSWYNTTNICSLSTVFPQGVIQTNNYIPPIHYQRIAKYLSAEDRCLCSLLIHTGYRVDDILTSLCGQWIGADVMLIESKTQKRRYVSITPEIRADIDGYRKAAGIREAHIYDYLCPSRRGGSYKGSHLNRSTLYRHFVDAVHRAGYDGLGYTVHSLRKMFAVDVFKRTGSILEVQKALNHDRISTTLIYLMDVISVQV